MRFSRYLRGHPIQVYTWLRQIGLRILVLLRTFFSLTLRKKFRVDFEGKCYSIKKVHFPKERKSFLHITPELPRQDGSGIGRISQLISFSRRTSPKQAASLIMICLRVGNEAADILPNLHLLNSMQWIFSTTVISTRNVLNYS